MQARRVLADYFDQRRNVASVTLRPGSFANATVSGRTAPDQGGACTKVASLLVTPPDQTQSRTMAVPDFGVAPRMGSPSTPWRLAPVLVESRRQGTTCSPFDLP